MPWLHRDDLEDESAWFHLDGEVVVGSTSDCDLVLTDPSVSPRHCRIEKKSGRWRVADLASETGTRVRGTEVSQLVLSDGDAIEVGGVALRFHRSRPRPGGAPPVADEAESSESPRRGRRAVSPWLLGATVVALAAAVHKAVSEDGSHGGSDTSGPAAVAKREPGRGDPAAPEGVATVSPASEDPVIRALLLRLRSLEKGRLWGQAVGVVTEATRDAPGNPAFLEMEVDLRVRAAEELDLLERRWRDLGRTGNWQRVLEEARGAAPRFEGTGMASRVRDWASLAALPPRRSSSRGKTVGTASRRKSEPSRPVGEAADATRGESLAAACRWREAAVVFRGLAGRTRDEGKRRLWRERARVLQAMGDAKARVIVDVNEERRRGVTLRIGSLAARCVAADEDLVQIKLGRGEEEWSWGDIPADRLLALFDWASVSPEERLQFAVVARHLGAADRAMAALGEAARDEAIKPRADELFAAWTGSERPAGGFVLVEGRLMTPEEAEIRRAASRARNLARQAATATAERFEEICLELRSLGAPALGILDEVVRKRFEWQLERARRLKVFHNIAAARARVFDELELRRKEALALIRDPVRYPYPYGPNQEAVQAEVDALVQRVCEVYERPATFLEGRLKSLAAAHDALKALCQLQPAGMDSPLDPDALLAELDRALDMSHHGLKSSAQRAAADILRFNEEIASSVSPEERELHRLTNRYRMMMGLRPVKIDEALVRAARKHSQEMMDLKYFAHASPVKEHRTPSMRAAAEGWGGGVSENIARGAPTPEGALRGWLHSSGHHRNIVGAGWTHLGCGKAKGGAFWTQNFGKGASSALSKEKKPPGAGDPRH